MCRKELVEEYTIKDGESVECTHFKGYVNLKQSISKMTFVLTMTYIQDLALLHQT